jgi:hypothetical protein
MRAPMKDAPPTRSARSLRGTLAKLAFSVALTLLLVEVGARVLLHRQLAIYKAQMGSVAFYYVPSRDDVLAYELQPGFDLTHEGRRCHINRLGIRDDEEAVPAAPRRVALLGDSVTFGVLQDQRETISARMQEQVDPTKAQVRVLNFGVPGYGVREVAQLFEVKNASYHVTDAIYVLNPNDFAWRDSEYEGADGGLYRMFRAPPYATRFFLRKVAYRARKSGSAATDGGVSDAWYEWMFHGTRDRAFATLRDLKRRAAQQGVRLTVVPLPAGSSYRAERYGLDAMYDEILAFLRAEGIPTRDLRAPMRVASYWDVTDHLTPEGNVRLAQELAEHVR